MADPTRRLNHWVPVSYLSHFTEDATEDGLLVIRDRADTTKVLSLPPRAIAAERDLYVVPDVPGQRDDAIERMLASSVEAPFIELHQKLIGSPNITSGVQLSPTERDTLSVFAAFQHMRTPHSRWMTQFLITFNAVLAVRAALTRPGDSINEYNRATGNSVTEKDLQLWLEGMDTDGMLLEVNEKLWLGPFLANVMEMATVIAGIPVRVVRAESDGRFVTSDHPVTIVRRIPGAREYKPGGGWLDASSEITLPLSPNVILVFSATLHERSDVGSSEWIDGIPQRTVENCFRWVYAHRDNPSIPGWLAGSKSPEWVIRYPGGAVRPGESIQRAVMDMMEKNPEGATYTFGYE